MFFDHAVAGWSFIRTTAKSAFSRTAQAEFAQVEHEAAVAGQEQVCGRGRARHRRRPRRWSWRAPGRRRRSARNAWRGSKSQSAVAPGAVGDRDVAHPVEGATGGLCTASIRPAGAEAVAQMLATAWVRVRASVVAEGGVDDTRPSRRLTEAPPCSPRRRCRRSAGSCSSGPSASGSASMESGCGSLELVPLSVSAAAAGASPPPATRRRWRRSGLTGGWWL